MIAAQVADLRELRAAGAFRDELRYFGLDAPSGARWYNFDPGAFLECGGQGAFGGWREGDGTGRGLVPGKPAGAHGRDPSPGRWGSRRWCSKKACATDALRDVIFGERKPDDLH